MDEIMGFLFPALSTSTQNILTLHGWVWALLFLVSH